MLLFVHHIMVFRVNDVVFWIYQLVATGSYCFMDGARSG